MNRRLLLMIAALGVTACYNRYKAPMIWRNWPYPYVQSGFIQVPCSAGKTLEIEIIDKRSEYNGTSILGTKYSADLVLDNELSNLPYFLTTRFCRYFENETIACTLPGTGGSFDGQIQIIAKTITPEVKGSLWGSSRGIVWIQAVLISEKDTLFNKDYLADATDGDKDVPVPQSSAMTIELAGKLVTATSIKRIADSISVEICNHKNEIGKKGSPGA